MRANDVRSSDPTRHGAYLCLDLRRSTPDRASAVEALAKRLGLRNEYQPGGDHPSLALAFLHRVDSAAAEIADPGLLDAGAVVHVAAPTAGPVGDFCRSVSELLGDAVSRVLGGVVRPPVYTGNAMHNFAYARAVLQQPAAAMPNAFLVPTSKSAAWWRKDWMERHTYFLPRYDDAGWRRSEGHALAAAEGIDALMRRTYRHASEPAPEGDYDFVNYFECADEAVPLFRRVSAALRDVGRNPEWAYVSEGPTWQGRRVATWADLFS